MTLPKWVPINVDLISHPANWFVIILMLAIAGFALHLLLPQDFPQGSLTGNTQKG